MRLEGKRVLITGTAGGQGEAAQRLFAAEGARVIGCDLQEGAAEKTAAELREAGHDVYGDTVDLSDAAASTEWVDSAAERLAKEESFYRDLHDGYRNHFARLGEPEGTVGVAASNQTDVQAKLAAYEALDVIVVRGLASARIEPMVELARAAAPA